MKFYELLFSLRQLDELNRIDNPKLYTLSHEEELEWRLKQCPVPIINEFSPRELLDLFNQKERNLRAAIPCKHCGKR